MDKWTYWAMIGIGPVLAAATIVWYFLRRWSGRYGEALARLARLIVDIRAGQAPIEELSAVGGTLGPVAQEVRNLFHEIREQKQTIASLDRECQLKIENRTSALQRLVESLRQQATRDPLTGLHNRRMLDQLLPELVRQCQADGAPLSLLMLDVENFRELNDTQGLAAGDALLRSLGQIIHSSLRPHDAAFRYGGDQFVVVFPGCDATAAQAVAKRLQALVRSMAGTYKTRCRPSLCTGSCALSELTNPTAENLLRGAGEALVAGKSAGHADVAPAEKRLVG
jgi:diguanylate cyclase (GGDEF)-like protein